MKLLSTIISFFILLSTSLATETHVYNWTAVWTSMNIDGDKERPVITMNGEFPWPLIRISKGDRVIIYFTNGLENETTSLHFHGLYHHNASINDGPPYVTNCPLAIGDTAIYNFTVPDQIGTYWYHSHTDGQIMDGLRGAFIVDDPDCPYDYDEEVMLTVSEWYHDIRLVKEPQFLDIYNPTGAEPVPQSLLFNDTLNFTWNVKPDTTYYVRLINEGTFVSQYIWMEDHEFEVIAIDSNYIEKNTTDLIYITSGQRYDVLIHTKNDTSKNYALMQRVDIDMLDVIPDDLALNRTNSIVYNSDADLPTEYFRDDLDFLDDIYLVPLNKQELLTEPDVSIRLDVLMDNLGNGKNYAFFNNITYTKPLVPTLGTILSAGEYANDASIYGEYAHTYVIHEGDVIDIIINNNDTGKHPFHLHGHFYQLLERGPDYTDSPVPIPYNDSAEHIFPEYPIIRDTANIMPYSWMRLRFKADNPGVWFFHCQVAWHLFQGLAVVFVEDPEYIQNSQVLTENWKQVCENSNTPYIGNAANNSEDFFNLEGEQKQFKSLPAGFTARGIVAMVFSCIAGFVGIFMIAIYGMAEIPNIEEKVFRDLDIESTELLADPDDYAENHQMAGLAKGPSGKGSESSRTDSH